MVNQVVDLAEGLNEVRLELAPGTGGGEDEPLVGHFYLSAPDRLRDGVVDLGRTRTPEDRAR